jgi:hypothetical protein
MAYDEKLAERIRAKLKSTPGLSEKKIFGGVGFLVNGNMACGVSKQDLVVRLSDNDFEDSLKHSHVRIFDMTGKPMKGWILVAPKGAATAKALQASIKKGVAFANSLPAK